MGGLPVATGMRRESIVNLAESRSDDEALELSLIGRAAGDFRGEKSLAFPLSHRSVGRSPRVHYISGLPSIPFYSGPNDKRSRGMVVGRH